MRAPLSAMLLAGLAWLAATPASQADATRGRDAADALVRLFSHTCLAHAGDPAALRSMLVHARLPRAPDQARARPGEAFGVPGEPGHLMVLSFDDGWCSDGGTGIDPHALTMRMSAAMRARGIVMRLMGAGPDGREQRYLLTRTPPSRPVVLLVLLLPSGDPAHGLAQANLFSSPMPEARP